MADSGDILNQQHLCRMFSSKFSGIDRLEMSPFLAVMRSIKVEYGQTQPEVFKMLLAVLHDYNPCLGRAHFEMTARYISLLLERHPEFAEYIISVLPPVPGNNTSVSPHPLHVTKDDVTTMRNDVIAGRNDFNVPKEAALVKGQSGEDEDPAAKRMRVKDSNLKFYNYTLPSVNAYVATQGIPQRIVSNKPQPIAIPAMATNNTQVGMIPSVAPYTGATIASSFLPIPSGGGVLLRPLGGGESAGCLGVPSKVAGAHYQTALLLSTRCPTRIAPHSTHMSLASIANSSKASPNGIAPNASSEIREGVSSSLLPKSSVITHMAGNTPLNTSITVAIGNPSAVKFKASSLERNTVSFPYSQKIVVNQSDNIKPIPIAVSGSDKILAAVNAQRSAAESSDAQKLAKIIVDGNVVAVPTFSAHHSLCYPNAQPANENLAGASGEHDLRCKSDSLSIPELAESLHIEPLDLSVMPRAIDPSAKSSKHFDGLWDERDLEDFSASEPNSQDDYDSQGTDGISVGGNSPATVEDPESDTFLAQMLKIPTPPRYSPLGGAAPSKEKKKPKTRYYTGKRRRPINQTKPSA